MSESRTFLYDELVMSDEQFAELVNGVMEQIDSEAILDMIISIGEELKEKDPVALEQAPPIAKMILVARRMYKYGFLSALYYVNEANKRTFDEV